MLLSEASKQSLQPSEVEEIQMRGLAGCHDCFEASLSAVHSAPQVGFGASRFAPTARVALRDWHSGAPHRSNNSLQPTATAIKCQAPLPQRAAAELNR